MPPKNQDNKEERAARRAAYEKRLRTSDQSMGNLVKIGLPVLALLVIGGLFLIATHGASNATTSGKGATPTITVGTGAALGHPQPTPDLSKLQPQGNSHLLTSPVANGCVPLASATGPTPVTSPRPTPTNIPSPSGTPSAGDDEPSFTMDDNAGAARMCNYLLPNLFIKGQKVEITDARATNGGRDIAVTFIPGVDPNQDILNIAILTNSLNSSSLKIPLDTITFIRVDTSGKVLFKQRGTIKDLQDYLAGKPAGPGDFVSKLQTVP